jgi:hypothetical protein
MDLSIASSYAPGTQKVLAENGVCFYDPRDCGRKSMKETIVSGGEKELGIGQRNRKDQ